MYSNSMQRHRTGHVSTYVGIHMWAQTQHTAVSTHLARTLVCTCVKDSLALFLPFNRGQLSTTQQNRNNVQPPSMPAC